MDELLRVWPDRLQLLCAVVARRGLPSLAGQIAQLDPEAGRKFLQRLDRVMELEQCPSKRAQNEAYRSPVLSALARTRGHDILGELE